MMAGLGLGIAQSPTVVMLLLLFLPFVVLCEIVEPENQRYYPSHEFGALGVKPCSSPLPVVLQALPMLFFSYSNPSAQSLCSCDPITRT